MSCGELQSAQPDTLSFSACDTSLTSYFGCMVLNRGQIKTLVARLQHDVQPESVWLFGSQATGHTKGTESDVDLCIIIKDELNPYDFAVQAYRSLQDMPFPKDIIVRQKGRFEERASWPSSIEHTIKQEGRLLYSA